MGHPIAVPDVEHRQEQRRRRERQFALCDLGQEPVLGEKDP